MCLTIEVFDSLVYAIVGCFGAEIFLRSYIANYGSKLVRGLSGESFLVSRMIWVEEGGIRLYLIHEAVPGDKADV